MSPGNQIGSGKAALCTAGLFLSALPLAALILLDADFVATANESLAYRYFYVARIQLGEGASVWLPQGFVTSCVQHALYWLIDTISSVPADDLRARLNLFALGTLGFSALALAALFLTTVLDRNVGLGATLWIVVVAVMPVFGFGRSGFRLSTLPDYFSLNVVLAAWTIYAFAKLWNPDRLRNDLRSAALAGALGGLMIANKVSMAGLAAFPALAVLLARPAGIKRIAERASLSMLGAVSALLASVYGFWLFDLQAPTAAIPEWLGFVLAPGEEPMFWENAGEMLRGMNLDVILATFLLLWLLGAWSSLRRGVPWGRDGLLLVSVAATASLAVYSVYRRPAETTLFDTSAILLSLSGITVLGSVGKDLAGRVCVACALLFTVAAAVTFSPRLERSRLSDAAVLGEGSWQLHDAIFDLAEGRPVYFVIPDNSYTASSVEELLLKGSSKFPLWRGEERARWILDRHAPGLQFRSESVAPYLDAPIPGGVLLVWLDRIDWKPLAELYENIRDASTRIGASCRSQDVRGAMLEVTHRAHLCVLPPVPIPRPEGLLAARVGSARIEMSWRAVAIAEWYRIEMRRDDLPFEYIGRVPARTRRYAIGELFPNSRYELRVIATSGSGASEPSKVAAVEP